MSPVMLMPIGRFARASRLSVKSLRNYDASGLLPAAVVDAQSGYRYYRVEQLARAEVIRSLRMVAMPLDQIARVLSGDGTESLLTSHLAALSGQRDDYDLKMARLTRLMARKEIVMSNDATVKITNPVTAAAFRTSVTYADVFDVIPMGIGKVLDVIGNANVAPSGAPFVIFHAFPDGDASGDISMCVPIGVAPETRAGVHVVEWPGGAVASIVHKGPYDDMGSAYASVATWIQERGHRVLGASREIYLNSPADIDEADLLTEIQWPIDTDGSE